MLMVISPAKTLDYDSAPVTSRFTQPEFLDHAQELVAHCATSRPRRSPN